jgi:hypothetical protein
MVLTAVLSFHLDMIWNVSTSSQGGVGVLSDAQKLKLLAEVAVHLSDEHARGHCMVEEINSRSTMTANVIHLRPVMVKSP